MKIKSSKEPITDNGIVQLIYGPPGVGKTTFGMSAENSLLYDFDDGAKRTNVQHRSDFIDSQQLTNWEELMEFIESDEAKQYTNHVFDTLGRMVDFLADYKMRNNPKMRADATGMPTMQGWGAIKTEFKNLILKLKQQGFNLTFIAHEAEDKNDRTDQVYIRPDVPGSSIHTIIRECDMVGRVRIMNKQRVFTCTPNDDFWAKNSAQIEENMPIPDLEKEPEREPLQEVFDAVIQKREEEAELSKEFDDLIEHYAPRIDAIQTASDGNELIEELRNVNHVLTSKAALNKRLKDKAEELGFKLTKNGFE